MTQNIAIVGGGLSGRLTAMQLAERGCAVTLFEKGARDGADSAAYVAAAMLAPAAEAADATPEAVLLGEKSIALWRGIASRLDTPVMMQENGSLIVWHTQDKPLAVQFGQRLERAGAQSVHWHAADIAAHEPQLAGRFSDGLYLPAEGQLDNRQMLNALAGRLDTLGVQTLWHTEADPAHLAGKYGWVIDCRGYGAKDAWNKRPSANSENQGSRLRGVRGEVVRVYAPEVELRRPVRLLHPRYPLYIAPKENHLFVIGATQIESESQAPVSVRSGLELLSALYAVHPAFGEAQVLETATGLRPALNHHNPEIRYDPSARLIEINGLFRHGFMIAPAVTAAAVRLAEHLAGGGSVPDADEESGLAYIRV
ncbi:bifunctional tRNA (mnm(5)s(2)U34)-methyltransferase/FAD-dependent cmnm(5)s(2)U34 oxidoreductase [Kingella potus]|uniref:D-amino-acid oxidase n=1 Tax=Kingella potus TaxID=265175 RepID=A0A377R147_9NEIS|nr:FAD-dependent oxidoreductase [Kingella potus]STR00819.1 bifunctional tRNA (mnm(5)s(2)U34)-methyltransferase/FAD-dependent cmnm(5)s(2)U34 oxidoreductase [Kingella potus]